MDYAKIENLTTNLRIILNLIRDYKEQHSRLVGDYEQSFISEQTQRILTKITNCEAQIKHNENQYRQTIKQINELI